MWAREKSMWTLVFLSMWLDLRGRVGPGALDSFAVEFWSRVVLYSIVLSSMMLLKPSFGLTRSLFILYVHEHDCLGFGMLTVETAVIHLFILIIPIATERSGVSGRIFGIGGWVLWGQDRYEWTWIRERKCKYCVLWLSGQGKYSNHSHGRVCLRWMSTRLRIVT